MGVSGSGKTTLGQLLSQKLAWQFEDADSYHSESNKLKMGSGVPLSDEDRSLWLENLRALVRKTVDRNENLILACSALKSAYRKLLKDSSEDVRFTYLKCSKESLATRLAERKGHFMPAILLDSQLAALEEPHKDEALEVSVEDLPEVNVTKIIRHYCPVPPKV